MRGANNTYIGNIGEAIKTLIKGLQLSMRHLYDSDERRRSNDIEHTNYFEQKKGMVTMKYPHEMLPVPDTGRYRLHNEMDDCIVCDKCAKICPVDCIEIDPIRSPEPFGETSDGTPKRIYAAQFDIDMAKCCFCGLCTTVCPTECLTMTKAFDFSEYDVGDHIYSFANMTEEEIREKREIWEKHQEAKEQAKPQGESAKPSGKPKPAFKPRIKPKGQEGSAGTRPRPVMKPKIGGAGKPGKSGMKPVMKPGVSSKPKPVIKPKTDKTKGSTKPVFKPKIKPVIKKKKDDDENKSD